MAEATGKFLLVEGDDDNYAKIMAAIGKLSLIIWKQEDEEVGLKKWNN